MPLCQPTSSVFAPRYARRSALPKKSESCPEMRANTYIQNDGFTLGQYGANEANEPDTLTFGKNTKEVLSSAFGEANAEVYLL